MQSDNYLFISYFDLNIVRILPLLSTCVKNTSIHIARIFLVIHHKATTILAYSFHVSHLYVAIRIINLQNYIIIYKRQYSQHSISTESNRQ